MDCQWHSCHQMLLKFSIERRAWISEVYLLIISTKTDRIWLLIRLSKYNCWFGVVEVSEQMPFNFSRAQTTLHHINRRLYCDGWLYGKYFGGSIFFINHLSTSCQSRLVCRPAETKTDLSLTRPARQFLRQATSYSKGQKASYKPADMKFWSAEA